jgi:outer membrane protein assembly factor BamB
LYCLDIASGTKKWAFPAQGHIESTPCVSDGLVVFGAGDDGLRALDAFTGNKRWRYGNELHVDSTPFVTGGRVFAGSGVSRRYRNSAVFCVDLAGGTEVWRAPVDLPAWGSPIVDADRLFIGLGHGRLDRSLEASAGALLCLDARTGHRLWQTAFPDAVMARPELAADRVFVNCRDGNCYALDRADGGILWTAALGSPLVTNPTLVDGKLFVVASRGLVAALDPDTGIEIWRFDVAGHARADVNLFSSPAVMRDANGRPLIYFGAELVTPAGRVASLYALRE